MEKRDIRKERERELKSVEERVSERDKNERDKQCKKRKNCYKMTCKYVILIGRWKENGERKPCPTFRMTSLRVTLQRFENKVQEE